MYSLPGSIVGIFIMLELSCLNFNRFTFVNQDGKEYFNSMDYFTCYFMNVY